MEKDENIQMTNWAYLRGNRMDALYYRIFPNSDYNKYNHAKKYSFIKILEEIW